MPFNRPLAGPKLLSEKTTRRDPAAVEFAWTLTSITGSIELPLSGLLKAVLITKFQTPTFVLMIRAPLWGAKSPGPLSTTVMRGLTPSKSEKVAAAWARPGQTATSSPIAIAMVVVRDKEVCFIVFFLVCVLCYVVRA